MSSSPAWYAVRTRSRHEKKVYAQLSEKIETVFLPSVGRWRRWKDRKKLVDWPLFPGYCFVRIDPAEMLTVLKCVGVAGIVSFSAVPAAIPDEEIESIRRLVNSELQFDPHPFIKEGDLVEVVGGPLTGVTGKLLRKGADAVLVVAITLLGRAVSVKIDAGDVKAR